MLRRRDVARLLVRFCGLLVVLEALISLLAPLEMAFFYLPVLQKSGNANTEAMISLAAAYFAKPFIYFIAGFGIIWWARRGTDRLATTGSADANDVPKLHEIEAILIAVLGVYFLCDGFVEIVRQAGFVSINVIVNGASFSDMNLANAANYGVGVLKLGIGVLLILRREGIVTLRRRIPEWVSNARRWRPFQGPSPDG